MPINVTVNNSGKIALPEFIKNISIYISSFKIKFQSLPFFHASPCPWSGIKLQIEWLEHEE